MTDLKTAAKQALEALELSNVNHWWGSSSVEKAITALRQALANEALDRMAENARELGLDYEPAQCWKCGDMDAVGHAKCTVPACGMKEQPAQEPEFFTHCVDQPYDWSEWVCPDPKSYLFKCCDCGLVHEAQFGVVRYKSETEREDCDIVDDPNLQAVFRMRRSEQWSPVGTAHRAGGLSMEHPAQQEPVGSLSVRYHRGCKSMTNTDFDYNGDLPEGDYELYTRPQAHEQAQQEQGDSICQEDDGCPTELAVLQRFWRGQPIPYEHYPTWCKPAPVPEAHEQEPVAKVGMYSEIKPLKPLSFGTPLYTRPQAREPEQPAQQEPVAYSYTSRITGAQGFSHHPMPRFVDPESWDITPLYTHPQAREPLTLDQLWRVFTRSGLSQFYQRDGVVEYKYEKCIEEFARAIEAAHGIKENT